jgi:hypothetical protein
MKITKHWTVAAFFIIFGVIVGITACNNGIFKDDGSGLSDKSIFTPNPKHIQDELNEAETRQVSDSSVKVYSAYYDSDLKYFVITCKVGEIKNMFLQYLSVAVVAAPGRTFTHTQVVGHSETTQVENINSLTINFNAKVWAAGAIASASLFSLGSLGPKAKAGAAGIELNFDLESVSTTRYTQTYHEFLVVKNEITQDMDIYTTGKKYAVAAFADVGIYQILRYDPQTKTATAIPGKSLWFNVESVPCWDMYEYSREEELSIPQQLKPFEQINVEVKEDELFEILEKSQTIMFNVGNPRVSGWYRTDWKPITLVFPALRDFGYKTVSFEWKTYWAECTNGLDCTAHVILDCADKDLYRENGWNYYDRIVNPGAGWKWAIWNFNSPIGTVGDRPYIRCSYGYDKQEKSYNIFGTETGSSYYDLSGTVSVTVTALK